MGGADLRCAAPGAAGSLGANKNIVIEPYITFAINGTFTQQSTGKLTGRTNNKINIARATILALTKIRADKMKH
jgi:hypothetical protein